MLSGGRGYSALLTPIEVDEKWRKYDFKELYEKRRDYAPRVFAGITYNGSGPSFRLG